MLNSFRIPSGTFPLNIYFDKEKDNLRCGRAEGHGIIAHSLITGIQKVRSRGGGIKERVSGAREVHE